MFLKIIENINSNLTTTYLLKHYKTKLKLYFWDTMWLYGLVHWDSDWIGITPILEQDWEWITGTSLQLPGESRQLHHKMYTIPVHYNGFPHNWFPLHSMFSSQLIVAHSSGCISIPPMPQPFHTHSPTPFVQAILLTPRWWDEQFVP